MWYVIRISGILFLEIIRTITTDSSLPLYHINTCDETGRKALFCDDDEMIRVVDVRLMPHNYSVMERSFVTGLCNGLNSCSLVDLRKQLFFYCKNYPEQQVFTSFQCVPEKVKPVCRTNICSVDNPTIKCRRGYVFHLIGTKCFSMQQECPAEVIQWIYRSCEGQRTCQLSVLRAGIPDTICNDSFFRQQNLFMDYLCVDKSIVRSTCNGTFINQKPRFGILQNEGYPNNPVGNSIGCYWAIYRDKEKNEEIEVIVHEAYAVEGSHVCDSQFLQLQYTLCETGLQTMNSFCKAGQVDVRIRSCGSVFVTHYPFPAGEDRGSRFLLSYSVKSPLSTEEPYEQYASQCEKRNTAVYTVRYTLPQYQMTSSTAYVKPTTERLLLPEDQPINDSSIGEAEVEPKEEAKDDKDSFDPWRMVTLLRVVVVNIFLGLVIVALIMALAFVCYRYIRIGKEKRREAAKKSETATTLDDKLSTEIQLLPHDAAASSVPSRQRDSISSDGKIEQGAYETTIFHFNRSNADTDDETVFCDAGINLSSFQNHPHFRRNNVKPQNAESAYSSLDDEQEDSTDYSNAFQQQKQTEASMNAIISKTVSAQLVKQISIDDERCRNQVTPSQNPLHQCKANDVRYAVVKDVRDQRNCIHSPEPNNPNLSVPHSSAENQNPCHIHTVPADISLCDQLTPTTMQLIPEHDCLLHKVPPPPPPIQGHSYMDSPSRYTSVQADV